MYSFDLTDEQRMLTETVQRFASRNMRVVYREADDPARFLMMSLPPAGTWD